MNCPLCGSGDLRDQGVIRNTRVYVCRKCNGLLKYTEKLTKLTDPKVLKSLR